MSTPKPLSDPGSVFVDRITLNFMFHRNDDPLLRRGFNQLERDWIRKKLISLTTLLDSYMEIFSHHFYYYMYIVISMAGRDGLILEMKINKRLSFIISNLYKRRYKKEWIKNEEDLNYMKKSLSISLMQRIPCRIAILLSQDEPTESILQHREKLYYPGSILRLTPTESIALPAPAMPKK